MRLTTKLTLAIVAGILIVQIVVAVIRIERLQALFESDISRDEKVFGHALALAAERTIHNSGLDPALDLIHDANHRDADMFVRWIWIEREGRPVARPAVVEAHLDALRQGEQVVVQSDGEDAAVLTYTPVRLPAELGVAVLEVSNPLADEQQYLASIVRNATFVAVILVVLCGLIAWLGGVLVVGRPLSRLVEHARRIGAGDFGARAELRQRDEFGMLAGEMNLMAANLEHASRRLEAETKARIEALEQLRHADRLTTVGTLVSGLTHELGTPLNVVDGHAELILEDPEASSAHDNAKVIIEQTYRMAQIIRQLMAFARTGSDTTSMADVAEVIESTVRMFEPIAKRKGIRIELEASTPALVRVPREELQQVFTNLAVNGMQSMRSGGLLKIAVDRAAAGAEEAQGSPMIRVSIADDGTGMDEATRARIFEPFFTTKDVGEGTGLGLAVVHGILRDRGCFIDVESERGSGSRFSVFLPEEEARP
jgi:two-component system, NtrC family, sensor kinase